MTDTKTIVDRYVRFWNSDPAPARDLAAETFDPDVTMESLVGEFAGIEGLIGFRSDFVTHLPDFTYAAAGEPQHHHQWLRTGWEIRLPDDSVFAAGTDVLTVADDRITGIVSFLDQAPEGFDPDAHHDG